MLPLGEPPLTTVPAERPARLRDAIVAPRSRSCSELDALLATLRACTPEAHAHALRVARTATAIAHAVGLPEDQVAQVEYAALLHDIGKLAIPDAILQVAGPLDDLQTAIVRTHVRIGFDIMSVVPTLRQAAAIVIATHERWDGFGYPAGLRREEIPVGARIVAVADAYDALVSARVYRDGMSPDEANGELARCAGAQFDPDIVRAWFRASERMSCS